MYLGKNDKIEIWIDGKRVVVTPTFASKTHVSGRDEDGRLISIDRLKGENK